MTRLYFSFPSWAAEDGRQLTDRERLVLRTVNLLIERNVYSLPVDVMAICRAYNIDVVPLSYYTEQGMTPKDLFTIWGNPDGVASTCQGRSVINYNDRAKENRARFTLSEELMHVLLGHTEDPRFSVFSQSYEPEVYAQYEREAKTAAAMLLFPASLWLRHGREATDAAFARVCRISKACAWTTRRWYQDNDELVRKYATKKSLSYDRDLLGTSGTRRALDVWPSENEYRAM